MCPRKRAARASAGAFQGGGARGPWPGGGRGARPRRRGETRREGEGNEGARGRAGARGHMGEGKREGEREGGRRMGGLKLPSAEEPVQSGRRRQRQRQRRRRLQPARRGVRRRDPAAVLSTRSLPRSLSGAVEGRGTEPRRSEGANSALSHHPPPPTLVLEVSGRVWSGGRGGH